jgi:chromosome segregation ATPase
MRAVRLIAGFLVAVIVESAASHAQDNTQTLTASNTAQAQQESKTSAQMFDQLRHSRIATVNDIGRLSQAKQADEQKLSTTQDQKKLLEQSLSTLSEPPMSPEDYTNRIDNLRAREKQMEDDLTAAKSENPPDQKKVDSLLADIKGISNYISEQQGDQAHAAASISQYNARKADLQNKQGQADKDIANLKEGIRSEQNDIDKKTQELQDLEDKITLLFHQ